MRFFKVFALIATATVVSAAPTSSSSLQVSNVNNNNSSVAEAGDCPKASRYACGQYMLEDGTRQDFVSQVFACIPRYEFHCNKFQYAHFNPTHPDEPSHMIAAKVDPGCTCTFYQSACDGSQYTETWPGWESEPNSPPWNRPAYTDKYFTGWWCKEDY